MDDTIVCTHRLRCMISLLLVILTRTYYTQSWHLLWDAINRCRQHNIVLGADVYYCAEGRLYMSSPEIGILIDTLVDYINTATL